MNISELISKTTGESGELQFYKVVLHVKDSKRTLVNKCLPVSSLLETLQGEPLEISKDVKITFVKVND